MAISSAITKPDAISKLIEQYGCGPIQFTGTHDALYERHLFFDNILDPAEVGALSVLKPSPAPCAMSSRKDGCGRNKPISEKTRSAFTTFRWSFSSAARWPTTSPISARSIREASRQAEERSIGSACWSRSPTPAWVTAGLVGWRRASSTRWRRCSFRRWATGCVTSTACSNSPSRTAGSRNDPDNWLRRPDPWEVRPPHEHVEVKLNCSFEMRERSPACRSPDAHPRLIGVPFDRPVVGYGGKTINTLRLWAAAAPDYFDFQAFSRGDFVGALAESSGGRITHAGAVSG